MRKLLYEIRQQDEGVRRLMFVLCCIIAVSLVGTVWLKSFKKDMYALLNPKEPVEDQLFADNSQKESLFASIFASIEKIVKEARALVSAAFSKNTPSRELIIENGREETEPHPLPVTE